MPSRPKPDSSRTGWSETTKFVAVECSGDILDAVREAYGNDATHLGCAAAEGDSARDQGVCSVSTAVIFHDGHSWVSVAVWCPADHHLEIMGEVMIT